MNRFIVRRILLVAASAIFFPLCGMMDTIKEGLYKSIEKPMVYNAGVYAIDKTATLVSNTIIRCAHIASKKKLAVFSDISKKIDRRLAQIEENIKNDEIKCINGLYKEFDLTNEEQQTINLILNQYKAFQKQKLLCPLEKKDVTLEGLPPQVLSFCKHINICPTAVELIISDTPQGDLVAEAQGLKASYQLENNMLIINDNDIIGYPTIILYPKFFDLSYEQGIAVIGHELTHLILQHDTVFNILGLEIRYFTGAKKEEILKSKNWKDLETIYERQAEILHKDAKWASIMRSERNGAYYTDHLFLKHYAQLTEIDELHKLKEKL